LIAKKKSKQKALKPELNTPEKSPKTEEINSMENLAQQQINDKIRQLPPYHQLAFGVVLSERFLPNYFAFFLVEQWGNPMVLLNGIDLLKNIVATEAYDEGDLRFMDELIEGVTPDMEDFPANSLASLALDVSSMLHECFQFVRNRNPRHIELCSKISIDTLRMYVQKRDELPYDLSLAELDKHLSQDALINNEIKYQIRLLTELKPTPKISNRLYLDNTIQAPNLSFSHLPGVRRIAV
jgi:uncharacterized protein YjaG (DUF416 family)